MPENGLKQARGGAFPVVGGALLLGPEQQDFMYERLAELAEPNIEDSDGMFELLPNDPNRYPAQIKYQIEGNLQHPDIVERLATIAEPRFKTMLKMIDEDEQARAYLAEAGEVLKSGENVVIATNHGSLIDIALTEALIYCHLRRRDYKFQSGIVLSKIISVLNFVADEGKVTATEVLENLCDVQYYSIPRTRSVRNSELSIRMPDVIAQNNGLVKGGINEKHEKGKLLLALAPSGSRDKPKEGEYLMENVNKGTAQIMMHAKTFVLPVAVWLRDKRPVFKICGPPRKIKSEEDVAQMMGADIAGTLMGALIGKKFRYEEEREDVDTNTKI